MRYLLLISLLFVAYTGRCQPELNTIATDQQGQFRRIGKESGPATIQKSIEITGEHLDRLQALEVTFMLPLSVTYCNYKNINLTLCRTEGYSLLATKVERYWEDRVQHHKNAEYRFDSCKMTHFIQDTFTGPVVFEGNGTTILSMKECKFSGAVLFTRLSADTLEFQNCSFYSTATIESSPRLKCIELGKLAVPSNCIDMTNIGTADNVCELYIGDIDVSKLKLNYADFHLTFDNNLKLHQVEAMYELMLRKQGEYGYTDGYKKLDMEYKDYKLSHGAGNIQDRFSKLWWNYGYNKEYIFRWTAVAFLILYVMLLLFFSYFINNVYTIDNLKERWDKEQAGTAARKALIKPCIALFYTCLIFFGIKLDVSKFKYDNMWAVVFIYVFYLFGVLCLVFIANYVLLK